MRTGPAGEIYLQSLDRPQEVMIPQIFTRTKRDTVRYLRTHFSNEDMKKLSMELLHKKNMAAFSEKIKKIRDIEQISDDKRKKLLSKIKTVNTILDDFAQNGQYDTSFSDEEIYMALFNSQVKCHSLNCYKKDVQFEEYLYYLETNNVTFDIEKYLEYSLMKNLLISYGDPTPLERSGSLTYKNLLKEKHISNKCNFSLTKTSQKILRLFNGDSQFILSLDIYSKLPKISIGAIRKNLNTLISMGILCRAQAGKYFAYRRIE